MFRKVFFIWLVVRIKHITHSGLICSQFIRLNAHSAPRAVRYQGILEVRLDTYDQKLQEFVFCRQSEKYALHALVRPPDQGHACDNSYGGVERSLRRADAG